MFSDIDNLLPFSLDLNTKLYSNWTSDRLHSIVAKGLHLIPGATPSYYLLDLAIFCQSILK